MSRAWCKGFAVAACVLVLASCSRTTFVYDRLDFLLPWYVEDFVDLDAQQADYLDELLAPFLAWHRGQELPCYLDLLDDLQGTVNGELTAADIAAFTPRIEAAWARTEAQSLDWLLALGEQLSDRQVEEFLEELEERQQDLEEEYLERSDEEFAEDSYDAMLDNAEDYLGRLRSSQRDLLRAGSRRLQRADGEWLAERRAFIDRLAVVLEREPGWQQRLRELLATREDHLSPTYREKFDYNIWVLQQMAAQVLNSRDERQDAHLRKRLASLGEDLQTLIARSDRGAGAQCTSA